MSPIYLALDTADVAHARWLLRQTRDYLAGVKIGLTLWSALGPAVREVVDDHDDLDWFLDVKWHDIPTQVAGAIAAVMPLRPTFITLHEAGGRAMLEAAVIAAAKQAVLTGLPRPKLLAVTTLTSQTASLTTICAQAHKAISCGMDGVIASPAELRSLRAEIGTKPIIMTPGVRRDEDAVDEHARYATPREAMAAGANFLVIGRPITHAAQPRDAVRAILESLI